MHRPASVFSKLKPLIQSNHAKLRQSLKSLNFPRLQSLVKISGLTAIYNRLTSKSTKNLNIEKTANSSQPHNIARQSQVSSVGNLDLKLGKSSSTTRPLSILKDIGGRFTFKNKVSLPPIASDESTLRIPEIDTVSAQDSKVQNTQYGTKSLYLRVILLPFRILSHIVPPLANISKKYPWTARVLIPITALTTFKAFRMSKSALKYAIVGGVSYYVGKVSPYIIRFYGQYPKTTIVALGITGVGVLVGIYSLYRPRKDDVSNEA